MTAYAHKATKKSVIPLCWFGFCALILILAWSANVCHDNCVGTIRTAAAVTVVINDIK